MDLKTLTKEEKIAKHVRSIKMSLVPAVMGVIAGFISSAYVLSLSHQSFSFLILAVAIYAQKYILPFWGVNTSKFAAKDWFYIGFMTFAFWYVSWAIIVNGMHMIPLQFGNFNPSVGVSPIPYVAPVLPEPQFGPFF